MAGKFGTEFMPEMTIAHYADNAWSQVEQVPSNSISVHPGAHVLHYASTCFEGMKAFRHDDGSVKIFRLDQNLARFAQSSELLYLPSIDQPMVASMIKDIVAHYKDDVPAPPSSMYIRPTHIGTEPIIGKAAAPSDTSTLFVLLSPVGDYFTGGEAALKLLLETEGMRCGSDHGRVKGGGNYASALKHIMVAKKEWDADQVLFCPGGDVQETGAANFILIDNNEIITKALDDSFLHGVTRSSLLTLAADNGMTVTERDFTVEELLDRASHKGCEAGLSGTAAVLASVGSFVHNGKEHKVGDGQPGPEIRKLRNQLNDIQWGRSADTHGWMTSV